jgi:hypothetical protein
MAPGTAPARAPAAAPIREGAGDAQAGPARVTHGGTRDVPEPIHFQH